MSPWLSDLLLRTQTDERLVVLAHLGHKRAFELIVERYRRPLTAYAARFDAQRADDLVQQTFLSALSALQAGTEVRHLRGWLYEIMRNEARRDYACAEVASELDETQSVTDSAQQVAERRMFALDALGAVAELPARQHDAIVQMAFHGLSRTEVADSMGLSEGAVRQLVHRARASLRTAVTAVTPMPVLRWLYSPRSGPSSGFTEATLGAGTASGAGIALKVGVGAIVASGVVATGVITAVAPHHRTTRLASDRPAASVQAAVGSSGARGGPASANNGPQGVASSGASGQHGRRSGAAGSGVSFSRGSLRLRGDGPGTRGDGGSQPGPGRTGGGDGGSGSGPGGRDGGGGSGSDSGSGSDGTGSGSSGPGSGDRGTSGSDGSPAGTGSGDGRSGGGMDGGSGSDGGTASQPGAVVSGHDGGGSGGDDGLTATTGSSGPGSGDAGSGTGVVSNGGSGSGSGSGSGNSSDSGSGSDGGSSSGSGSSAGSGG